MKYMSIDIETTGLNPDTCEVIEIGAVVDDLNDPKTLEELPRFHTYVLPNYDNVYTGEPFALAMHSKIFKRIANQEAPYNYVESHYVGEKFAEFVNENFCKTVGAMYEGKVLAAGKNFSSFDKVFLENLSGFSDWVSFHHRVVDPAMLYCELVNDDAPPNLKTCMERAEIKGEVQHTALEDALDVVKLIRVAAFGVVDPNQ